MKYPWMPLFNGDLLANTLHLSAQEFGAYMLLIIHAWEFKATVKVADAQRIARVGNRHWVEVRDTLAPFFDHPNGLQGGALEVVHSRVAKELATAAEMSNKRKGAAMQMHANRRASASGLHAFCIPTSTITKESSSVSEQSNGRANPPATSPRPQPNAACLEPHLFSCCDVNCIDTFHY